MKKRLIIGFRSNASKSQCLKIHKKLGTTLLQRFDQLNCHVINAHNNLEKCIEQYSCHKDVMFVERDLTVKVGPIQSESRPNDPGFVKQWGLRKVSAPNAWNIAHTSPPTIPIAILDTGIDQNHEDLSSKITLNRNFTDSPTVDDRDGHGTHVAGIAAAITNNALGVSGMSYNAASLMNIKVLGDEGFGFFSWIADGIIYAADQGAKVINMSLGSPFRSRLIRRAIGYAWREKGALIAAAAGNDGTKRRQFPAAYKPVVSVAATKRNDRKARFSSFGSKWVDVAAPGVGIYSTAPNHGNTIGCLNYCNLSGTSMSTPFVSGLVALIWATSPNLTNRQVRRIIFKTTDNVPGSGRLYRFGRINAHRSLLRA
jgi:thermitase